MAVMAAIKEITNMVTKALTVTVEERSSGPWLGISADKTSCWCSEVTGLHPGQGTYEKHQ